MYLVQAGSGKHDGHGEDVPGHFLEGVEQLGHLLLGDVKAEQHGGCDVKGELFTLRVGEHLARLTPPPQVLLE